MKRLILISLILLMPTSLIYGVENMPAKNIKPNVFAGVIRDKSPTSEKKWNIQHALNVEIIHSLRDGDWLKEWVARPGRPFVLIDTMITANGFEKNYIINNISGTSKEWFFSANIPRTMETTFESFRKNDKDYQCCLIIITKGKMSNKEADQIRRYASIFKVRGWPVCIVSDKKETNRRLLIAGNNDEFDIQFIDEASISDWINNVRRNSAHKELPLKEATIKQPEPKAQQDAVTPSKPDDKSSDVISASQKAEGPIEVKIVGLPDKKAVDDGVNAKTKEVKAKQQGKEGSKKNDRKRLISKIVWPVITILVTLGLMSLIVFSKGKSATKSRATDQTDDNMPSHLIVFYRDQRYDLGSLDALGEIFIGSGIGSTIYIDNETVEDKHIRIFNSRRELKIQNLAGLPIIINGLELTHRRKSILDLPVDIELTSDVTVTVLSEPVETNKELNDYENENT